MGKLQAFEIHFDGNRDLFKPGDVVSGQVRIVLSGEKGDIRGIKVSCKGKAETHWSEQRGSRRHRRTVHYSWKILYFKHEIMLRGAGKDNQAASRMKLPMGDHHFPFQFQIPSESLPPPFQGPYGFVKYYVKATIDRPWKFDHKVVRYFTIWTIKDLNFFPNILNMPTGTSEKTVCCLCCESGPIIMRASLDKSGYVPGETIFITIELDNRCGRELLSLIGSFHQKVLYRAKHGNSEHIRHSANRLTEIRIDGANAEGVVTYHRKPLHVPGVPPNNFENCPNIEVSYVVKVTADVTGTPIDVSVELPIVIGTIPAVVHPRPPQAQPHPQQGYAPPYGHVTLYQGYAPTQGYHAPQQGYAPHQDGAPQQGQQDGYPSSQVQGYAPQGYNQSEANAPSGAHAYAPSYAPAQGGQQAAQPGYPPSTAVASAPPAPPQYQAPQGAITAQPQGQHFQPSVNQDDIKLKETTTV